MRGRSLTLSLRDRVKRAAPDGVIAAIQKLRAFAAPRPIDEAVLGDLVFEPDATDVPRLTLLAPALDPPSAFGGVITCVDYLLRAHSRLRAETGAELRLLTERGDPLEDTVVPTVARSAGLPLDGVSAGAAPRGATVAIRRREVFVAYNWWCSLNLQPALEAQAAHYGAPPTPKLHFLQDYEPHFYEFSAASLLARQAFNIDWPLWVVVNSAELAAYYRRMGDRADRMFTFEPVMTPALRPFAAAPASDARARRILVYARPQVARNCFSLLVETLRRWAATPGTEGWEVVSAGAAHGPVALGDGRTLRPLGKLSLEDYGALLRETALGLSLMASPHPSYPPLEMAHFGVRVLTNGYPDKDLSHRHDNILTAADARPGPMAAALAALCAAFDADPGAGARAASRMPDYLDGDFDCLDATVEAIAGLWR